MARMYCSAESSVLDGLFRTHHGWLTGWLRRKRWIASEVEDMAADVFVALVAMPNISAVREPRALITTIARRMIYDARRRDDLKRNYEAELAALPELLSASPEEQLAMVQALAAIETMLKGLSHKARAAFLMSQIDGMKYADIAAELGVSVSMVRKYVAQGLKAAFLACGDIS